MNLEDHARKAIQAILIGLTAGAVITACVLMPWRDRVDGNGKSGVAPDPAGETGCSSRTESLICTWYGRRESNPRLKLGKLTFYH